ncbi:MAG: hypothetical protein II937_06225 [Bacteroidales bacterium]|nr:hypothetical protein [Bacteroidales bacterium]
MKALLTIIIITIAFSTNYAQYNMLGENYGHIWGKFNEDPEFTVKVDTVNNSTIVLTCKTSVGYPYYKYEIDIENNECISFGLVSKDRQVFETYIDMLSKIGDLVENDLSKHSFTYKVRTKENEMLFYTFKQPFRCDEALSRRNIFYVLVTKDKTE